MASTKLTETNPEESFENIKTHMQQFNTMLQYRKYNNDTLTVVPYFLYVITQNEKGELISMALGDDTSKYNTTGNFSVEPVVIPSSSVDNRSISDVITKHISQPLQKLYNTSSVQDNSHHDQPSSSFVSGSFNTDTGGGSRSMKNRRRNRKKNKNTKRRNRK